MPDRGQTETLGFVLVFAIITASIGLVFATGFTGLNDVREFEATNNAERAFEVLADNLEDVTHRNAPSRSTEIKLSQAELRVADPIQIRFDHPAAGFNVTYGVQPIVYDAATGTELVYVQGAVIRAQGEDAVMVHESTLILNESRTVVPIVQTRLEGNRQVSGTTTTLVRADLSQTRLVYANQSPTGPVWINVTSPRAGAWRAHLEESYPDATCTQVGDTTSCSVAAERVHVTLIQVDVSLE